MAQRQALVWPPVYNAPNQRVKGFYPSTVTGDRVVPLLESIESAKTNTSATRISIRAIVPRVVLEELREHAVSRGICVEAIFPINPIVPDCFVVYLSFNKPERVAHVYKPIDPSLLSTSISPRELERRTEKYRLIRLVSIDAPTSEQIAELFASKFNVYPVDMCASAIRRMPDDHVVMAAYDSTDLISIFMADMAHCSLDESRTLTFFDFVNVASKRDGLWLIPRMAREVVVHSREYENPIVYAEARADIPGLQICCSRAGMQRSGTLVASSLFRDHGEKEAEFRDTVVWYIPQQ